MTFVASCRLVQCLQSLAEVPLEKHIQILASIISVFSTDIRTESACFSAEAVKGEVTQLQSTLWSNGHFVVREVSFLRSKIKMKVCVEWLA